MREVGVHLEDVLVVTRQSPLETVDVGRAEAELAFPLFDEKPVGKLLHQTLHDVSRAVRTVVFDDKDVKLHWKVEDVADDLLDVLLLVVSRDYYKVF